MSSLLCVAALVAAVADPFSPPEPANDPRFRCWSSWHTDLDEEMVITEPGVPVSAPAAPAVPAADPGDAAGFTGIGWTFGNYFDDVEDSGYPLGPAGYGRAEREPLTGVDGRMSFAVGLAPHDATRSDPASQWSVARLR